ncbi:peptidyl-prolyl cis-trans isomerase, fkbp-type family protein [Cryptosporidium muris RN66]|uniref:peptidylprolyl isomerase n=1 Tax=Cryptosporidium muris (strain RN66) TaxID=441375 RepID=B6AHQ1_CRYMR|nr:peptidyl-prolyl cis-trans isomerase, fkbp-type family protein [Cryptosporidium muris RN66]EEA07746.1 peptidyl-prolyl cis-trans isomerase, fkbp-type family protein [Cryptosporidium muris RN66]|eukprot:XP_002142095.1 peptidyl-prolyl cis-trans isomerase, fkbp-type family protein [Cryptosporidium muris RN66]
MFKIFRIILSTNKNKRNLDSFKYEEFGLTLAQITLVDGDKVDIFVKLSNNNQILRIATVTKAQPNTCLRQLKFPINSIMLCKGNGTIHCIANLPLRSKGCHKNEIIYEQREFQDKNQLKKETEINPQDIINFKGKQNSNEIKPGYCREFSNGLKYEVLSITNLPKHDKPQIALNGSNVKVKYEGRLASNGKKFDSGIFSFTLGCGDVIKGFDQGVKGMLVNEKRRIFIPSKLGYGLKGSPPIIPRNADLVFEISLLQVA